MLSVTIKSIVLNVTIKSIVLNVTIKSIVLNVTIKSIVLNVIILNVVEPLKWTQIPCVFFAQGNLTKRIDKMPCEIGRVNES
jgi:hypothetical protein